MKSLCVFCGSRAGNDAIYEQEAKAIGEMLAMKNIQLVYGGGKVGLMGIVADAVLDNGGEVIGVIPSSLVSKEVAHFGLSSLKVVNSMHERKELMYNLSDAFLALPGGFGTLDEFCEIFTWFQLGIHQKPIGFLNSGRFFDALIQHFKYSVEQGFVDQTLFDKIHVFDDIPSAVNLLED